MIDETIAAIATAVGEGGIGIIRISGSKSRHILESIFDREEKIEKNRLTYGHIIDNFTGKLVDEVMVAYMKGPNSYTAEDVAEIQCHGSVVSLRNILHLVLKNGAVMAEPGEFTKRAFLNGRLDLSQAEAVIDLIRAKSDKSFDVAMNQSEGNLSKKIKKIRADLVEVLVNISVNIDYPDEDIEKITYKSLLDNLTEIRREITLLLSTADTGKILRQGLRVSIIGKPNVGKSSLMNALLKETRAIVTSIPGTTRDTIEESMTVRGIPVVLTDTAGIRETEDVIEKIGIEKSKDAFNKADLVILILDSSRKLEQADFDIINKIGNRKAFVVFNKTDLKSEIDKEQVRSLMEQAIFVETSIKEEVGIEKIEEEIEKMVYGGQVKQKDDLMVTNLRHKKLLEDAETSVDDAIDLVKNEEPLEVLEIDVNHCYEQLGSIIGETVEEDIIDQVFARFCLGK